MLNSNEFIEGLFSLLFVVANIILGTAIMLRYFKYKEKAFIFVGLSLFGVACPWWSSAISFLTNVFFNQPLPTLIYFFLGNAFAPILTFSWIIAVNILIFEGRNKIFVIVFGVILAFFNIGFFLLLFLAPETIGTLDQNHLNVSYYGFVMVSLIGILLIIVSTGIIFSVETIKSEIRIIKLKGWMILSSYFIFLIFAPLDLNIVTETTSVIIVRIFLILNYLVIYIGWIMPKFAQKFFLKINLLKPEDLTK